MIQIIEVEQGTEDWLRARMGVPTASEFKTIIGVKKDAKEKATRRTYMLKLAGEIVTGEPMESYSNPHMERGKAMEDEARDFYAMMTNGDIRRVGFVRGSGCGCSPDSLIGEDGGLEIKTALPHIQIERLFKNELPPEHRAQVQGNMLVSGRAWWDFVSFWPKLPPLIVRVERDAEYCSMLSEAIGEFNAELAETVERIRHYGEQPKVAA